MQQHKPLLIVDGDLFAHRYYHALPKSIRRADGGGGNLIDGVGGLLIRLWDEEKPRAVLVAWDTLTVPTYRHEALPAYQGGRHFDRELLDQLDLMPQLVEAMGFTPAKADGYEADDFLAAGVAFEEARGGSAGRERRPRHLQLVSERTTVLQPQVGGGALARIGPAEVRERYGVEPAQVPDFIALRGDPSDKIPGARGSGENGRVGARPIRQPRSRARARPLRCRGGRAPAVPAHRNDGSRGAGARARRPAADLAACN